MRHFVWTCVFSSQRPVPMNNEIHFKGWLLSNKHLVMPILSLQNSLSVEFVFPSVFWFCMLHYLTSPLLPWVLEQQTIQPQVRFHVLTAASMMFRAVFWVILPCRMIVDRPLMMEAVRTSETSVDNHFTRQYNQKTTLNIILAAVRTWNLTLKYLIHNNNYYNNRY
jgi:hypothetical protein